MSRSSHSLRVKVASFLEEARFPSPARSHVKFGTLLSHRFIGGGVPSPITQPTTGIFSNSIWLPCILYI